MRKKLNTNYNALEMKNNDNQIISDKQIIRQAEEKVTGLYESVSPENLLYHNIEHTREVVSRANEIAAHYELSERDILVLNIGAWFHDVGHLYTDPSSHEQKSAEMAREWLIRKVDYAGLADETEKVILATKLSTAPDGLIQEILKDADTYHFGTPQFRKIDKLLKKEMALRNFMVTDWEKNTLV